MSVMNILNPYNSVSVVDLVFLGIVLLSGHLHWGVQVGGGWKTETVCSVRLFVQTKENVKAFFRVYFYKNYIS